VITYPESALGAVLSMTGFWNAVQHTNSTGHLRGYVSLVGLATGFQAKGPSEATYRAARVPRFRARCRGSEEG